METKQLLVVIVITTVSAIGLGKPVRQCDLLHKPENVVSSPPYVTEKPCPQAKGTPAPEKLQYKVDSPETVDKPHFEEKETAPKEENGAFYQQGREIYVDPDPTFRRTDEPISDLEEEETAAPSEK
jgi:hypothetical protein